MMVKGKPLVIFGEEMCVSLTLKTSRTADASQRSRTERCVCTNGAINRSVTVACLEQREHCRGWFSSPTDVPVPNVENTILVSFT